MSPVISTRGGVSAGAYGWGAAAGSSTAFESIATATGTGSSGTITFSSIPSTFTHLQIRGRLRTISAGDSAVIRVNGQSSGYPVHLLYGTGASALANANTARSGVFVAGFANSGTSNSSSDVFICDILDYRSTTKNKTIRVFAGTDRNSSDGVVMLNSGLFLDTSAITSVSINTESSYNFTTTSTFALYGIKAAV